MANIHVEYGDGKPARNVKVTVSVDGGGMVSGFTGSDGWAHIQTSGTRGKIYVNGKEVRTGSLQDAHVVYPR